MDEDYNVLEGVASRLDLLRQDVDCVAEQLKEKVLATEDETALHFLRLALACTADAADALNRAMIEMDGIPRLLVQSYGLHAVR